MVLRIYRNYTVYRESPGNKNDGLNEIYYAPITYNTARTHGVSPSEKVSRYIVYEYTYNIIVDI